MKGIGAIVAIFAIAGGAGLAQDQGPRNETAPPASAAKAEPRTGGWWDDVFAERNVTLTKVLGGPEAWRDIPVNFVIQYRQPGKAGPSFFTRFEPDQWLNFVAWPDEAALWEKKAFDTDFQHLFIRRDSADFKVVSAAALYDRFAVSAIVRDVIKGKPWIEVTSVRKLAEKITEGSLVHLVKGLTLRDHRRFDAAAREFEAADGELLPVGVRLLGMREQAFALLNCRKPKAAEDRLLTALGLDPENTETALALAHVREAAKAMPEHRTESRPAPVVAEADEPKAPAPVERGRPKPLPRPLRVPESRPTASGRRAGPGN